jgi:hypothetical protein
MRISKIGVATMALIGAVSLGGCAEDMYGGYGGYGGYGPYGGVGVGYSAGYGYGYGDPYYGGWGSPFGWYDDFYYPGVGMYVYDSYRRPRMWNDRERRYWTQREGSWRQRSAATMSPNTVRQAPRADWSGFDRRSDGYRRR